MGPQIPESEWMGLEYMDWKSGGDTNFAPIASAEGEMECAGFWDHGKPDKDGIWTKNAELCPTLKNYVRGNGHSIRAGSHHQAESQHIRRSNPQSSSGRQQPAESRERGLGGSSLA